MLSFRDLKIRNKLRILSFFSILSLIILGFFSNYFYNTGKALSLIINGERIHNNTFQEGVESFYKYQVSSDKKWIDTAISKIEGANEMARTFGILDQLMRLPKEEYIGILYDNYKQSYNYDRSNAYLMASRIRLLQVFKSKKLKEAQQITMKGYQLGEEIKNKILSHKSDPTPIIGQELSEGLNQMRLFYNEFAFVITSLNVFTHNLLYIGIFLIVSLLILIVITSTLLISRSITGSVYKMVEKVGEIAKGNLDSELSVDAKNEMGELSIALNKMVTQLKASYDKSIQDSWHKSGINLLNEKLSGNQKLTEISSHSLSFMMDFLHSQLGSIYLYDEEHQYLKPLSSSGVDSEKLKSRVKLNEGITGQAAFSKQMLILNDIPDESYISYSSTGEYKPNQIIVAPLIFKKTLVGILELSSLQTFTENEKEFIQEASGIIAINLNSSENLLKTNELLRKTQDQASELQIQQEELRVSNEELVEHTKVLTENEKKLQVQQEELRVANEELEERTRQLEIQKKDISDKNDELTEIKDKLENKAKELEQVNRYKSEFLANMSHELRTPMNSLLILSNLLAKNPKGNLTDDQVQSAKIIYKSGADLLHLINDVLDLSKIEAGKVILEIETVKTIDLKEDILMDFTATAEDKKLSFEVRMANDFPGQIETDRYRLMQILKNLLSNAFKFTSRGTVSVDFMPTPQKIVFKSPGLTPENTCCIKVSDTGVGIQEEKMDAIFEAFQQADGSISRNFGGTGLGLSISRELIRMLGGEIQLESKVNEGSSFFVYLPTQTHPASTVQSVQPEDKQDAKFSGQKQVEEVRKQQEQTPFIEDDRDNSLDERTVLIIHPSKPQAKKFLQQARAKNFRAIVARDIQEGIILAEKFQPRAVMLAVDYANVKDPHYQQLKKHPLTGKLPVHLITPIDYNGQGENIELKTVETSEFADALNLLDSDLQSPLKRILLVEDDEVTRNIVADLLSVLDVEIVKARLAGEAFNILNQKKFDCIILDLGLPDYSGNELLEKLKKNNVSIPKVIVYTGKEMSEKEIKSLNYYTDTIILKGIKSDERLMDEVTLFLHQVSKIIPDVKAKTLTADDDVLFKGKKILIVDDDIRNVFSVAKVLEDRDIEVVEAENGQVAIDILNKDKDIDLVLMDIMMPVMDGFEAMRIIRNSPGIKDIPIICLSAKAMKEDYENALKNGANDYLSKPLNEKKLFSMLKIWLYKK